MKNISLFDPSCMAPGPKLVDLTAGTEVGAVTTLIRGISKAAVASNVAYATGGALLHKFSATAVINAGIWPHSIAGTGVSGEDVCHYNSQLLYSYNTSTAGNIGMFNLDATFDDDWWTSALVGAALSATSHQMINGGDDNVYIANGRYVASLDGTTDVAQGLDLWADCVVESLTWNDDLVYIGANRPNISGANNNQSGIYRWDGFSDTWENNPVPVEGRIGALLTALGTTFCWYQCFDFDGTAINFFGYVSGNKVEPLRSFDGTLPAYYQVSKIGSSVAFAAGSEIYAYGPIDNETDVDFAYLATPVHTSSVGGISCPFGKLIAASHNSTTGYSLAVANGYATDSNYKTKQFMSSGPERTSRVDTIVVNFDVLASGARVDLTLRDNKGTALWTGTISFAVDGAVTKKVFHPKCNAENFRLEFDHTNGSTSAPVKIRETFIDDVNLRSL